MSLVLPGYPDVHEVLTEVLTGLTDHEIVTRTPPDLQDHLPLIRVRRIGGPDDGLTDVPRCDVDVYADDYDQAWALAEQVRQRMSRRRVLTSAGLMDRATTEVGPHEMPYPDSSVRLIQATYRISLRRRTA